MTREEEIQEAIKDIHKSIDCNGLACWQCIELSIGKGISWADQHPRKGLWDTEKVEKVLGNLLFNKEEKIYRAYLDYDAFFEDLRKAMEN